MICLGSQNIKIAPAAPTALSEKAPAGRRYYAVYIDMFTAYIRIICRLSRFSGRTGGVFSIVDGTYKGLKYVYFKVSFEKIPLRIC